MAVVKADAYGHGAVEVARTALAEGAAWLGVALLDEALELREAGIAAPILVLGWVRPSEAWIAAENDISLTVFQSDWLSKANHSIKANFTLNIHLKLDTGMGRLGIRDDREMLRILRQIRANSCFRIEGAFTHFATADELDPSYFNRQHERFRCMLSLLSDSGADPAVIHCANSAAALQFPDKAFDLVRLGISMYGLTPSEEMNPVLPFQLKPAFSLHSRLVHVKQIKPGDAVSYGATYVAEGNEWIGTVPMGYADGWLRKISAGGEVLVDGARAPIVGRICMDFFMVRLPEEKPIGTAVTLIGEQGNDRIRVDDIARMLETITYEIPCMISDRVPRVYKNGR
jgi:alanine racemase